MAPSPSAGIKLPYLLLKSPPSNAALIDSYLRPWVETGGKTGDFIHDFDVYADDPAALVRHFPPAVSGGGERAWYFYTPLRNKSVRGDRKERTVATGVGCWHSEAVSKPVYCYTGRDGTRRRQVGHRQTFTFVKTDTGVRERTGWLMLELSLPEDGAAGKKPQEDDKGILVRSVLCKVYRSPRKPEPSGSGAATAAAAAAPGYEAEADVDDDDESSDATVDDDDYYDRYDASLAAASGSKRKPDDVASSQARVAARSRYGKANVEISGWAAAAPGRKEKTEIGEDSAEAFAAATPRKRKALGDDYSTAAATPRKRKALDDVYSGAAAATPRKRKALDDDYSGAAAATPRKRKALDDKYSGAAAAAAPARKKKPDGSGSPGAPVPTPAAEMQCPQCGFHLHLLLALKKAESKSETEPIKKDESPPPPQRGDTRGSSQENVPFLEFL